MDEDAWSIRPAMSNNAQHSRMIVGDKTQNAIKGPSLDMLYKRVAPNAILDGRGRVDEVGCFPGTCEEVISRIERWGTMQAGRTAPMFWLSGPAGAGKSAIVQTVAKRCEQRGMITQANFFFFRGDSTRNYASPLMATLLFQIIRVYPPLKNSVARLLLTNPSILDSTIENQLSELIAKPLCALQQSSLAYRPVLLLLDGLDECDLETKHDQQQILDAFDKVFAEYPRLFRVLVASRHEPQIQMVLNSISSQCLRLHLDNKYSPESDIRVFVNAQFEQIRKTHSLDARWPSVEDVDYIVERSFGRFVYAAVIMRFISVSSANPALSLERVKSDERYASNSPLPHLDAIFFYSLAQGGNRETLKDILCAHLLIKRLQALDMLSSAEFSPAGLRLMDLLQLYNPKYTQETVLSSLANLSLILQYASSDHELLFHQPSFPAFLMDESRSGEYFADIASFSYKILPVIWKRIADGLDDKHWLIVGLLGMTELQESPPGLMEMLASSKHVWIHVGQSVKNTIFETICSLCTSVDDYIKFKCIVRQWIDSLNIDNVESKDIEHIPFISRHLQMARANRHYAPNHEMTTALRPDTDYDRHELAQWLDNLLHRIHREIYHVDAERYSQLLMEWISWAISNGISCDGLDDLPGARQHIRRITKKKRATDTYGNPSNVESGSLSSAPAVVQTPQKGMSQWSRKRVL